MMKLSPDQKKYAEDVLRQLKDNGVALLQLPTGQGKTIVALKAAAELLGRSRWRRPLVLVTRKRRSVDDFVDALDGQILDGGSDSRMISWIRDAGKCGGLRGLVRGKTPKFSHVLCWCQKDLLQKVPPVGSIVIIDEVHRFQSFLRRQARKAHLDNCGSRLTSAKRRQYLLLSATPINPARISSELCNEERTLQDQMRAEDILIRNSFLDLYRAMISLSFLSRSRKDEMLACLATGSGQSLEEFSDDLKRVMGVLRPVPDPAKLCKLGPSRNNRFETDAKVAPGVFGKSVLGLMDLQMAILKNENAFYCAERMAMAGAKARTAHTVGVVKMKNERLSRLSGVFHHQPSISYARETVASLQALDRNGSRLRHNLTAKIDALYEFLVKSVWKKQRRKSKWRVLIFCAYRGSVAALASELERRFQSDKIICRCRNVQENVYGSWGSRRIVWATEGYADRCSMRDPERALIERFSPEERECRKYCDGRRSPCPQGFVLVTSDRSSESIDLHRHCDIMIHFDLDWSPLRMIQRYGRLWRIDRPLGGQSNSRQVKPRPPAVFHLVQPGSVDEEILWRLENRWHRLHTLGLGLDQVTFRHALGGRIYGTEQ